ncbi:hypothetical protein KZ820_13530 [Sphingomonas sp. RRHST34]|uniref:Uncharacterized protein n=1 Tax=Sphingomonas citri TaxID=2862499 RepID=A0ABS7BQ81_9SPHN|nr:hypothetical protein [Sphingomonas citri]MBW6531760.1 hypothetical protein [Sphingomonas citri]
MRRTAAIALTLLSPAAAAQDVAPVISPSQAAEGAFHRSRMGAQAEAMRRRGARAPRPGSPEFQRKACANRPAFRRRYGADDPRLRQLESLCAGAGY